jgi:septal ring factor EnvC (AmiA/AmiB activator)
MALIGLRVYLDHLRTENERLTREVLATQVHLTKLTEALMVNQAALDQREAEVKALTREKTEALAELEKIYREAKEACS